jgi:phosphatidylglycerophosphate synthase
MRAGESEMSATHVRQYRSPLAAVEKALLISIAGRLPAWVTSDRLSALGLASMAGGAGAMWIAASQPEIGLPLFVVCLVLNWFGDSLDGTVARVRKLERPRYGYYLDHVLDLTGVAILFAGFALSGYMHSTAALLVVASYFLVSAESFLATHSRGVFNMSFAGFGPTELRILLAIGALSIFLNSGWVNPFGLGRVRLFDLGGAIGSAGMVLAFVAMAVRNGRALYLEETKW